MRKLPVRFSSVFGASLLAVAPGEALASGVTLAIAVAGVMPATGDIPAAGDIAAAGEIPAAGLAAAGGGGGGGWPKEDNARVMEQRLAISSVFIGLIGKFFSRLEFGSGFLLLLSSIRQA